MFLYEQLAPICRIIVLFYKIFQLLYKFVWLVCDVRLQCFRLVGAGLATVSLGVLVWELGIVFNG